MKILNLLLILCALCAYGCNCQTKTESPQKSTKDIVIETIMGRHSIRKYKPTPIPREDMQTIITCGINAPNGMNKQPWEVRIVDNPDFINGITKLFITTRNQKMSEDPNFKNMFRNAPTVVFIATPGGKGQIDCGLMGENMIIAAQAMGIGSCCLGGPISFMKSPEAAEYLNKLEFSEGYELLYAIGFGYPDESPEAKPRDSNKVRFID